MTRGPRRGVLCALVALGSLLVLAAGAHASMVTVDTVAGQIYDVDATRILFRDSDGAFGIKDRVSGDVAVVQLDAGRGPLGGFLTSHGAMLAVTTPAAPYAHVEELRDGSLGDLGGLNSADSLRVAGDWAIWSNGSTLTRRDLSSGANLQVATDAGNTQNDVAANGDVAFWTNDYSIKRFRTLVPELLASADETHWQTYPRTDGTNVVWRETGPTSSPPASLRGYGPSGGFTLDHSDTTTYAPEPGMDYTVAGGWVAFTQQATPDASSARTLWLRDDSGLESQVFGGIDRIGGLAPDGELIYIVQQFGTDGILLFQPGQGSTPVASVAAGTGAGGQRGYQDHFFKFGGRWYGVFGGELRRIAVDDRTPGAYTTITSAPTGNDNPSHATFELSSTMPDAAGFECSLDGAPYAACDSPVTFTGLAAGQHSLAVRSVDSSGRFETDPATVSWGVERNPPDVRIDIDSGFVTRDRTPTFEGDAGTEAEDDDTVTLLVYANGGSGIVGPPVRTIETTRVGGRWSATIEPALPDGNYDLRARQFDRAGTAGNWEALFVVDATPPAPSLDVSPQPVLTGRRLTLDASASHDDGGIVRHEWDLDGDGDFERDTGTTAATHVTYTERGDVRPAVRVTDEAGNRATLRKTVTVFPEPPPGLVGVTINDGDQFTNDPNVFVSPVWPPGAANAILSNDGGFREAVSAPLAGTLPWRLDSSGPERLPKTIYARFAPNGTTYQDDIILDETRPTILAAEITGVGSDVSAAAKRKRTYHLHLRARDRTAGVNRMQITTNRRHPGKKRRYRSHVDFRSTTARIFVRVRDRAGNWSHWKRCEK